MKQWKPADIIALLLVLLLYYIISVPVFRVLVLKQSMNEISISTISEITIAIIALVSVYIGRSMEDKDDD